MREGLNFHAAKTHPILDAAELLAAVDELCSSI